MNQFAVSVLIILLSIQGRASLKVKINFSDIRDLVESKNERVLAKDYEMKAAESRKGSLLRSYLPDIELYGAQETIKKGSNEQLTQPLYGVEARVNLFNGGRDSLLDHKYQLAGVRLKYEKQITISDQVASARELFWESLYLKEQAALLIEAQQFNKKNLQAANRMISSGVATKSDRIEFEMKEIELKRELAKSELELNSKLSSLSAILGFNDDSEIMLNQSFSHEHNWEDDLKHTYEDHAFLAKPAELKAEELELEARSLLRTYWPQVDAYAGWNQYNQREEDLPLANDRIESVVGVRMIIPIGTAFKGRNEGLAQQAEAQALKLESKFIQRQLNSHLHTEIAALKFLHDQVHDAELNIKKANSYYSMTQSEYNRGVKNSPDVLNATERLFNMRLNYLKIIKEFQISKSHALSKIGK